MKRYDVVCVGSASIDCFAKIPVDFHDIKHGSKLLIDDIRLLTGGGGTNVAVGLARLGLKTGFIGEVGQDLSANVIKHELKKEKVDFIVKQHSRHQTAYSVVLEAKGKDRAILVYKGASSFLHPDEVPKGIKTKWLYLASVTGASFKTLEHMAGFAKKNKIGVYFNPSSYMTEQGYAFLKKVISATTILAVNKEEAETLLNTKGSIYDLLKGLHKLGPHICIITNGSEGVHVYDGELRYFKKARKMHPVDTTGAGDAFGAGFLGGFIMKPDLPMRDRINFAMELGLLDSESVIAYVGAKRGLLSKKHALEQQRSYNVTHK
jgi:sugar/nucleoside kinase (ribokinase family)